VVHEPRCRLVVEVLQSRGVGNQEPDGPAEAPGRHIAEAEEQAERQHHGQCERDELRHDGLQPLLDRPDQCHDEEGEDHGCEHRRVGLERDEHDGEGDKHRGDRDDTGRG